MGSSPTVRTKGCRLTISAFVSRQRKAAGLVAALCAIAAGCSNVEDLFVQPGKYEIYNCEQIAIQGKAAAERERELKELMGKASRGAVGELVNSMAYRSEYLAAVGQLKQLEQIAVDKKCDTPWRSISDRSMW